MSSSTFTAFAGAVAMLACACACGMSTAASSDGAPGRPATAAPEPLLDAGASDHWAGCDKREAEGLLFIGCGRTRIVSLMKVPEMTAALFDINARRFFEPFPGAVAPVSTTMTLTNGVSARAMESSMKLPDADGGNVDVVLMAVGISEADGSGQFIGCSGLSAASCKADVGAIYASARH